VQAANFMVAGSLYLAFAAGLARTAIRVGVADGEITVTYDDPSQ